MRRLCILLLGTIPFLPLLFRGYFLADDFAWIKVLHAASPSELLRLFVSDWSQGIWHFTQRELRPFIALSFRLDYALWGLHASGYYLTNILLHLANCFLVFHIARHLVPKLPWIPLPAAALFAVFPCHSEPVSWIAGRVDLIPPFFYFACFLFFLRANYPLSLLAFAAGLFSKESVIALPAALTLYWLWTTPRRSPLVLAPFYAVIFAYLLLRIRIFGMAGSGALTATAVREYLSRMPFYATSLFLPLESPWALWLLLLLLAAGCFAARRHWRDLVFSGPLWCAASILPLVATYRSDRHLYIASAGAAIFLALIFSSLGRLRTPALSALILFYGVILTQSSLQWAHSGVLSREMKESTERLTAGLPPGAPVILGEIPPSPKHVWPWALPFAFEPPFSDIYSRYRFLEGPEIYCCPDWWEAKRPVFGSGALGQVYVLNWENEHLVLRTVPEDRLKTVVEHNLNRPYGTGELTEGEARRLLDSLQRTGLPLRH